MVQGKRNQSALLAKYYAQYKKNSRSKVFAPLAESYRKLGMLDDAFKVLKNGLKYHPTYSLGYIVLAHCYFDQKKFELTYTTLKPILFQNADNISMQKIFAQTCLELGYLEEALETFKYLLFLNPKDRYFAQEVKRLEDDLLVGHKKFSLEQIIKSPDIVLIKNSFDVDDDQWVQKDFTERRDPPLSFEQKEVSLENPENWELNAGDPVKSILSQPEIKKRHLEDEYFADEFIEEGDIEELNDQEIKHESPLISHTLIDLYCSQGYYDKAIELLRKTLELNPDDQPTIRKLDAVIHLRTKNIFNQNPEVDPEEIAHDELINLVELKVKNQTTKQDVVIRQLSKFLELIHTSSLQYK